MIGFIKRSKSTTRINSHIGLMLTGNACHSNKEIQEIIEGVFIRSRVKPLKEAIYKPGSIFLNVIVACIERSENYFVYTLGVHFGRSIPLPAVLFDMNFSYFGAGPNTAITTAVSK